MTKVSLKTSGKVSGKMQGKTPERILAVLKLTPAASIPELAAQLKKSESAIERAIRQLREPGQLRRVGSAKGDYWEVLE
ncbi:MAG: winged helix-turn-helix transcriptional regulator [Methylococcales bacterium]|nr:winged helix-turn-helix transcriptional regulator [Methylococcales bacterium]